MGDVGSARRTACPAAAAMATSTPLAGPPAPTPVSASCTPARIRVGAQPLGRRRRRRAGGVPWAPAQRFAPDPRQVPKRRHRNLGVFLAWACIRPYLPLVPSSILPHTPCEMLYLVHARIGCCLVLAVCYARFVGVRSEGWITQRTQWLKPADKFADGAATSIKLIIILGPFPHACPSSTPPRTRRLIP